ncbi:DUF5319 family protein [Rhodococcus sp. IEGM 1330]|uniref:DUF5319 family protein n=1 Tax=Rhodococcus sp. IEGM 1330 TaxID=3082225 RepID=UPI00295304A7|nr:DUF5319 family protein [Rhodococcus sp. IEGM 1330]MDV8024965.1 DUF5319 family protein [Rhodococcus sp. IEGM 1330]
MTATPGGGLGPISAAEAASARADLVDLHLFESYLAPVGVKGLAVWCDDCAKDHLHGWFQLRMALSQILAGLEPEHAVLDDTASETEFVSWDFCRGFAAHASGNFAVHPTTTT